MTHGDEYFWILLGSNISELLNDRENCNCLTIRSITSTCPIRYHINSYHRSRNLLLYPNLLFVDCTPQLCRCYKHETQLKNGSACVKKNENVKKKRCAGRPSCWDLFSFAQAATLTLKNYHCAMSMDCHPFGVSFLDNKPGKPMP